MPGLSINYSEALHTYTVLLKMFYLTNHYNGPSIYVIILAYLRKLKLIKYTTIVAIHCFLVSCYDLNS